MKHLYALGVAALLSASAAAQEQTFVYSKSAVTAYNANGGIVTAPNGFFARWATTATNPQVTVKEASNKNNMTLGNDANLLNYYSVAAGVSTYAISIDAGYVITGYTVSGTWTKGNNATATTINVTPAEGGTATAFATGVANQLVVTGLETSSTSFSLPAVAGILAANVTVTYKLAPARVVWKVVEDGHVLKQQTVTASVGQNVSTANVPAGFLSTQANHNEPAAITTVEGGNEMVYEYTGVNNTVPFTVSTTAAPTWYHLNLKEGLRWLTYDASAAQNIVFAAAEVTGANADWAFYGNPYEGFTVKNRLAGDNLVMSSDVPANGSLIDMRAASPAAPRNKFMVGANDAGFFLRAVGGNNEYVNDYSGGGKLSYWVNASGANDGGSRFRAIVAPTDVNYGPILNTEFAYLFGANARTGYVFTFPTVEKADELRPEYTTLSAQADEAQYNAFKAKVQAAVTPLTTGYYQIFTPFRSPAKVITAPATLNSTVQIAAFDTASVPVNTVAYIESTGANTYTIKLQGNYINNLKLTAAAQDVTITNQFAEYASIQYQNIGNGFFHAPGDHNDLVGWAIGSDPSKWLIKKVEAVNVTLNRSGDKTYATTYLPFAAEVQEANVNAYAIESVSAGEANLSAATKGVPAMAGVLLMGDEATATKATLKIKDTADAFAANVLEGSLFTAATPEGTMTLGENNGEVGFFSYTGANLRGNAAFIPASTAAGANGFVLGGLVTGINQVAQPTEGARIYDLQGRQVRRTTQSGLYIVNGQKVFIP